METALTNFLISISGFEVGLFLFFLNRKRKFTKFVESLTILVQIMAPAALSFPVLAEHKGYIYLFIPIYIAAIHAWLFFTKYIVFSKIDWQIEDAFKKGIRQLYVMLAFGIIAVIILVITMGQAFPQL